jgi:hypothetical protein
LLVVPVAALIAFGAGGAQPSAAVLGPLVTFALPGVAMVAFWWEDWPGTRLRAAWSGWFDTLVIAVIAVVLTVLGQIIVGHVDMRGIFDPTPGVGHAATFPATLPLAGAAFTAMLQLTLVCEGWPLRRFGRIPAGLAALAVSWAIAVATYMLVVDTHPPAASGLTDRSGIVPGAELGALLTVIGAWQVVFFVGGGGWPFAGIGRRWIRLPLANVVVIGGGLATYFVIHGVSDIEPATITAGAGAMIAAGLVVAMLFEGALRRRLGPAAERPSIFFLTVLLAIALYAVLDAYARGLHGTVTAADWVAHATLNALGVSVILHVGVGRRWPFGQKPD